MKKIIIVFILSTFPLMGFANDIKKREMVEELLVQINADSIINTVYSQMDQMMKGLNKQLGVKPTEQELFDRYTSKMVTMMKTEMSWEKMKAPMIDVYLKHYTEKEIQDMVAFYNSETGKSMIEKMPLVMQDSMLISQSMTQGMLPKIQAIAKELKAELETARQKNSGVN